MLILALFNNYIPDFLGGGEGFNRTCFVVGIIVCIVYVALVMKNRADRAKKGYSVEAFGGVASEDGPDLCGCSCFYVQTCSVQRYSEFSSLGCCDQVLAYLGCWVWLTLAIRN